MFLLVERIDAALAAIERVLVIVLTTLITLIMMAQVILRYFFNAPIFWAEEISVQLLVFVTLIGLALLVRSGGLVAIDFLPRALPDKSKHGLNILLGLVMLAVFVFIAWLGWTWIIRPEVRIELSATTQLPRWYTYAVLPFAFVMMLWHQTAAILRDAHKISGARA